MSATLTSTLGPRRGRNDGGRDHTHAASGGKSGRSIPKGKYEAVRKAMLSALRGRELTHTELMRSLAGKLSGRFDGNVHWYGETVKLDLEVRKVLQRMGGRPERYRVK